MKKTMLSLLSVSSLLFGSASHREMPHCREGVGTSYYTTYFDTGIFNIWNFLTWSNPDESEVIDWDKLCPYLDSLFSSFQQNHYTKIYLAFSQIADISLFESGDYSLAPQTDTFLNAILYQLQKNCPEGSVDAFLENFIAKAHQYDVDVILSFGGENATGAKICPDTSDTPEGQAIILADFLEKYKFRGVDFDLESDALVQENTSDEIQTFFSTLKTKLEENAQISTIALMGSTSWATDTFKMLFFDEAGNSTFTNYFDAVNLMLYGSGGVSGKYYIDASDATTAIDWGIEEWITILTQENAYRICIGFQDNTYYEDPSASAGETYTVDPDSRGKSAAMIYNQMADQLEKDGYPTRLGNSFWWPDPSVLGASGSERYSVGENNTADFLSETQIDFASSK